MPKKNVTELNIGSYSTLFTFTNSGERKADFKLVSNSSAYAGTYLNYKWFSLKYSFAVPGTSRDEKVKLKYTSLGLNFALKQMRLHPFYDSYNGLLIPVDKHKDSFAAFRGIRFTDAGFDFYYFTNTKRFSFNAAHSFSAQQVKSAGSFFLMATPVWQKVEWENPSRNLISDSATFSLLEQDPQWISFNARIGYIYNFAFQKGKWAIVPACLIGTGRLQEINSSDKKLQQVMDIQVWLKAGYNGQTVISILILPGATYKPTC